MITSADEIYIDFSTSCTRDEAVAKLLGWMRGPIRRKYINVTEDGISEDQLPYLHRMDEPIKDQLLELREVAQQRLYKAFDADEKLRTEESRKVLSDAADEVERHSQTIYHAAQYFRDIDDELAKGEESKLRVDKTITKTLSDPYIGLSSLDAWAQEKYRISILAHDDATPTIDSVIDQLKQPQDDSRQNGGLGKIKADNLYVTLALFVEAFSKSATRYHNAGGPVVINIAEKIAAFRKDAFGNDEYIPGQGSEAIKSSIVEAMKRMKKKLKEG